MVIDLFLFKQTPEGTIRFKSGDLETLVKILLFNSIFQKNCEILGTHKTGTKTIVNIRRSKQNY